MLAGGFVKPHFRREPPAFRIACISALAA
jgi:hypothetical protein